MVPDLNRFMPPFSVPAPAGSVSARPRRAAAVAELQPHGWRRTRVARLLRASSRPAGLWAALTAPGVASYTAVPLSHTGVPGWNAVGGELPFVFTGSTAASGGGWGMLLAPVAEAGPARAFAALGATQELVAARVMEHRMGLVGEAYRTGRAGRARRAAELATAAGLREPSSSPTAAAGPRRCPVWPS